MNPPDAPGMELEALHLQVSTEEVAAVQGRDIAIAVGVALLVVLVFALLGAGMMGPGMMGWGGWGFSPWWGILMMLFWVLIIAGVGLLVVWLFRQGQPAVGPTGETRALDILRERYARGEINREEFERMRRDLGER